MRIMRVVETVPGGLMLIPLLLGAVCKTFSPDAGRYFGSFTNGLITGTVPILAVWFFCMGATINVRAAGTVLRKSGTLLITKMVVAWLATLRRRMSCRRAASPPACWPASPFSPSRPPWI